MAESLRDLMDESFEQNADRTAIRILRQSDQEGERGLRYVPTTYRQVKEQRDRLASGLAQLGLEKGQRVGVLTDGGLEPILVFLAGDMLGISSVPLCGKLPDDILVHNINRSKIALLFVDPRNLDQVERISDQLDDPPQIVLTEGEGRGARTFFDLIKEGSKSPAPRVEIRPDDESKVIFTSGSSGMPKGVIQTHENIAANVRSIWDKLSRRDPTILFKSAPDYHTLGILNIYFPLTKGWTLDLARSADRTLIDVRHSEPYAFLSVPLILDKVYANVRKEIDAGGVKGKIVGRAVKAKQRIARGEATLGDWMVHKSIGGKVVAQIKAKLSERVGKRLELILVGAAKADPEALDFFQDVLEIAAFEGYGTTECAPLIAVNTLEAQKVGSVGRPVIEVKIVREDGTEIGSGNPMSGSYRGSGGEPGELWACGAHVMRGYLDDPEQTEKALVRDEKGTIWYRTGDLFDIDDDGFLTFRGRLGRQFKLRNGEFVNPELLERVYARIPLIEHVLVCGDQSRTFPLPLVTVNVDEARSQDDIPDLPVDDDDALRRHPAIVDRIREQLLREATDAGLPNHERPQKVLVIPEPLSEEDGTLTRGLKKLVPKAILACYEQEIEETYQS